MKIAVDAFGGDHAPEEIVQGCVNATQSLDAEIILVGNEEVISRLLNNKSFPAGKISIVHASEVIETGEAPVEAIRKKKDSSLVKALELVKNKEADAIVSAGNTGAYLAGAVQILRRLKGIKRPALTTVMPTASDPCVIMDVGANADCRPEYLVQFAHMGAIYVESIMGVKNPKVGLLNIGAEESKGNALTKEAHQLLKNAKLNFVGNVEARDLLAGKVHVIVCDGFTGNVVIKLIEGTASTLFSMLKSVFYQSMVTKLAAGILKPGLRTIKKKMDYSEYGGAPFMGIDGVVFKAHGSSDHVAIENALRAAAAYSSAGINEQIRKAIEPDSEEKIEEST